MERFERQDPSTQQTVQAELLDPVLTGERWDDYREVRLHYADGRTLRAVCWRDPMERGGHWSEEPGMVIVRDLTDEHLSAAVDDFLHSGEIEDAFEPFTSEGE